LRNLNGSVLSLLTGGAGNNNYWHWLFDVLPRFGLCSKSTNLNKIDYFLLPSLLKQFQKETLDSLNIPEYKRISSEKFRHIQAKELIMTDHPVMLSGNATKDILNIPGWISLWLRNTFLNQTIIDNKKTKNKIYIDRNDTNSNLLPQRIIINEEEIKKYLLDKNFTIVKLHETKFINQINLFYDAECVIGLHGGGFGNIVFCKPGTKIIELKSSTASDAIKNLAKKNDLNYISLEAKAEEIYKFEFPNQQGGIKISISSLIKVLEN
jgi:capsular polysaccharide biosynthesis protein